LVQAECIYFITFFFFGIGFFLGIGALGAFFLYI